MAVSDELRLSVDAAIAQARKLDRVLKEAITAAVKLDILPALEDVKILRKTLDSVISRKLNVNLSTVEAQARVTKLETSVKALRTRIGSAIQFNLGTSEATRKLESLNRLAKSVRANTASAASTAGRTSEDVLGGKAQDRLNASIARYTELVPAAVTAGRVFTDVLRNQAIASGLLAGELKSVTASMATFTATTSRAANPVFGPGRKELQDVINAQRLVQRQNDELLRNQPVLGPGRKELKAIEDQAKRTSESVLGITRSAEGLNRQLIATGRSMSVLFTLPAVVAAAFAAFNEFKFQETIQRTKVLTDAFVDFDKQGNRVSLTADQVTKRMGALRGVFNDIAGQTGQTPNDIAEGFYFVASAGGVAATRLSILRVAAQGAAIGLGSVQVVADALTSVLNAYGEANITAASAGDILVQAVNDAKVEASELAPQLGRVLPLASLLGINFAQVAESLALLTQNGNSAAVASTQLRGILQSLVRPTSEQAVKALASVGLTTAELRDQVSRPVPTALLDTLLRLRRLLPIEDFAKLFRRVDALNGALTLTSNSDAAARFRLIAEAAENASGSLEEFERFADENVALQIKQGFAQLLAQLQPLGVKILPLVADGIGVVIGLIDQLGQLLSAPFGIGTMAKVFLTAAIAAGPLVIVLGKILRGFDALKGAQRLLNLKATATSTGGGFVSASGIPGIVLAGEQATQKVSFLSKLIGTLPGLFLVAGAGAIAFFSGTAIASENLTTSLLGVAGAFASVGIAAAGARSILRSFGVTNALALGAVGVAAGLLVAGIAAFSAYREATTKSAKALDQFQHSLEGLTANEALKSFGASLQKSLEGITGDDRVTKIEIPELQTALRELGLDYDELGKRILNIVLLNPNDLAAQARGFEQIGNEIGEVVGEGRLTELERQLRGVNSILEELPKNRGAFGAIADDASVTADEFDRLIGGNINLAGLSDSTRESLRILADEGLLAVRDGMIEVTGASEEVADALGIAFGEETTKLITGFGVAFQNARQTAIDTTGEFTLATNSLGSFVESLDEDGNSVFEFKTGVDDLVTSLKGLNTQLDEIIDAVFGKFDLTTLQEFKDEVAALGAERIKTAQEITSPIVLDEEGKPVLRTKKDVKGLPVKDSKGKVIKEETPNEGFIDFTVDLLGPDGGPARLFLDEELAKIDEKIQAFLVGPEANPELAFGVRDLEIADIANKFGINVEDLQALLTSEGKDTVTLKTEFGEFDLEGAIIERDKLQRLIDSSPLSARVKLQVADDDTGALFGSRLLELGLNNGQALVDFIIRARAEGTTLPQLQTIFGAPGLPVLRSIIINAIEQGTPVADISKAIAAIDPVVRKQLFVDVSVDPRLSQLTGPKSQLPGITSRIEGEAAFVGRDLQQQLLINAVIEGADEVEELTQSLDDHAENDLEVRPVVAESREYTDFLDHVEAGDSFEVRVGVNADAFNRFVATARQQLLNLQLFAGAVSGGASRQFREFTIGERGGIFGGGGFRAFRAGGMALPGDGMARHPMIARAPFNTKGILWAEPQTHGEAYVPYNPIHRPRAEALVERVARDFGMSVISKRTKQRMEAGRGSVTMDDHATRALVASQQEVARLAGEVARLAQVIEERETQPLIGTATFPTQASNPQAAARYMATAVAKAVRR